MGGHRPRGESWGSHRRWGAVAGAAAAGHVDPLRYLRFRGGPDFPLASSPASSSPTSSGPGWIWRRLWNRSRGRNRISPGWGEKTGCPRGAGRGEPGEPLALEEVQAEFEGPTVGFMVDFGVPPPSEGLQAEFEGPTVGFMANFGVSLPSEEPQDKFEGPTVGFVAEFWGAIAFGRGSS